MASKCVFLDRDGVINRDRVDYAYKLDHFEILPGVLDSLKMLKDAGYKIILITNQSGISQGIYTVEDMEICHAYLQQQCNFAIDDIYYAPLNPSVSNSLSRKPDSLMFERAITKHEIDCSGSFMIGDKERDLIPAIKLGIFPIIVGESSLKSVEAMRFNDLYQSVEYILSR
ncbi:MAG: HAD-IIIA family hydrolase [Cyclobacteriaceae bacterium]|nr:HAD-IIIA family hydrolase [Cyclobacteriaceae bacterium]